MQAGVARKGEHLLRRVVLVAALVGAVALLYGCGSSSNPTQTFKNGYNSVRGELNQTGASIASELQKASTQSDAQVEQSFRALATRFQTQLSKLRKLKPPASVAADWNSVVAAAERLASDLNAVAAAAAAHSSSAAKQAGAALVRDAQSLQKAVGPVKTKLGLK